MKWQSPHLHTQNGSAHDLILFDTAFTKTMCHKHKRKNKQNTNFGASSMVFFVGSTIPNCKKISTFLFPMTSLSFRSTLRRPLRRWPPELELGHGVLAKFQGKRRCDSQKKHTCVPLNILVDQDSYLTSWLVKILIQYIYISNLYTVVGYSKFPILYHLVTA